MALGDLVQSDNSGFASNQSCTLASSPTSGNLLIIAGGVSSNSATVSTAPTGFTELETQTGNACGTTAVYYKISAGTETTAAIEWSTSFGVATYLEIDFDGNTLSSAQSTQNTDNVTSTATSQGSGSVTPAQSTNVCVMGVFVPNESNCDAGAAWSGSLTEYEAVDDAGQAGYGLAGIASQTGSTSFTFSTTDTGDQMWGTLLVFNAAASSGRSSLTGSILTKSILLNGLT